MASAMNVDISMLSVTVSLYVLGLAVGQLIGGPLSDKKGRRPVMAMGLGIFAVGSLLITTSIHIESLWLWRFVQAIGGGIAVVGVPATIRDNTSGKESAKLFSLIALIMMIAPSIAPTVGTLILRMVGWQWIFHLTAVLALCVAVLVMLFIPKGKMSDSAELTAIRSTAVQPTAVQSNLKKGGLLAVFKEKRALGYMIAQAFAYSVLMTFVTNASMIYMTVFDVTPERFSVLFIANICGLITINRLNTLLLRWYEPTQLLKGFLLMQVTGGLTLLAASIVVPGNLHIAVTGFVIAIAANGGIMSNASTCFLKYHGHNAGSASAVLGAVQYTVGAAASASAALISMGRVQPIVIAMLLCSIIALAGAIIASHKESNDIEQAIAPMAS
jgi:DHA1 family bicyclomycin/chloramphenicol resistance-like MFS transporter